MLSNISNTNQKAENENRKLVGFHTTTEGKKAIEYMCNFLALKRNREEVTQADALRWSFNFGYWLCNYVADLELKGELPDKLVLAVETLFNEPTDHTKVDV